MTKRRDLVAALEKAGFARRQSGRTSNHDVFVRGDTKVAVPRHRELNNITAREIARKAGLDDLHL